MTRRAISTTKAAKFDLPFSQGIKAGNLVFVSGQCPTDPTTGKLVRGGIGEQTRQVMENIGAILEAAGSSFDRAVKATVFITDIKDFAGMNAVYRTFFTKDPPARSTVEVSALALKGAKVEIEMVAVA
jgi:2-iminobutanoate/2-iminopropanoate deaminase